MPLRPIKRLSTTLLSASLLLAFQQQASAERYFHRYWKEKYAEMEEPEVIEDGGTPIDPAQEEYLFDGSLRQVIPITVFPSADGDAQVEDEKQEALRGYVKGSYYFEQGSPTEALRAYDKALKEEPDNNWYKMRVATLCIILNDLSRAESLLGEILDEEPENYRAMLRMGEIKLNRQQYPASRDWYLKVLEVKPNNIEALQSLTQLAYKVDQDLDKTIEYSERILHIDDKDPYAMLWNAEASALTGNVERSADLFERLIRFRPGMIQQMIEIGRRLVVAGETEDAIFLYERAMLLAPDQDSVRLVWEQLLTRTGGDDAVDEAYQRLVDEAKGDMKVRELYAEFLRRSKRWEELRALREDMLAIEPAHMKSLLDLAMYHSRQGDFSKADPYFQRAIDANPADPDTYLLIGEAYLMQGDVDKARPLLERALTLDPNDTQGLQTLASIAEDSGDVQEAERLLRKAIEASPANAKLLKQLGGLYHRQGDSRRAAELYQQAIAVDPRDLEPWISRARIYLQEDDIAALDTLESEARRELRDSSRFYVDYGYITQEFGEFARSRRALERAIAISPADLDARKILALTYVKLGEPDEALRVIREADPYLIGQAERQKERDIFRGTLLLQINREAAAEDQFKQLIEDYPDDLSIRELHLVSLVEQNKEDAVREALNQVVRDFGVSQPVEAQLLRARIHVEQGEAQRAVGILKRLVTENPDNAEARFQLAMAASELNDISTAEEQYKTLIDIGGPESNSYYEVSSNNLGYLFARNGTRLDEAKDLIQQALKVNPNAAYILDSLGWVYFKLGNLQEARDYLERAAMLSVNDAEIHSNLGQVYEELGERELARRSYDKALELDPEMDTARERRDALAKNNSPQPETKVD